ncbi:MAG: hypothetical protein V4671_14020, partial [Armatimonadota bacterium]
MTRRPSYRSFSGRSGVGGTLLIIPLVLLCGVHGMSAAGAQAPKPTPKIPPKPPVRTPKPPAESPKAPGKGELTPTRDANAKYGVYIPPDLDSALKELRR